MSGFARPWLLALAVALPPLLAWLAVVRRRHQRVPSLAVRRRRLSRLLASAPVVLALAGVCAAWASAAGPRRPSYRSQTAAGRNLVVLLDASGSMADPGGGGGLAAARRALGRFVESRRGDRVGLVVFGRRAAVLSPLTLDHDALLEIAAMLRPATLGGETAIGDGLAVALQLLESAPRGSAGIVLVSDGRNNAGALDPRTAARAAADRGVVVDAIGVTGAAEAGAAAGIDEALLRDVASATGGEYVRAGDDAALDAGLESISRLRPAPQPAAPSVVWRDRSAPLAAAAALLLLGAALAEFAARRSWA